MCFPLLLVALTIMALLGPGLGNVILTLGLVLGVAGATSDRTTILVAGVAGLAAGALSMAAGEYVSVSTQRDSEHALLDKERRELVEEPEEELAELAHIYVGKGLSEELALRVAQELTEHDALGAHALAADGESTIHGAHHVQRGYENIERKFADLGARIARLEEGTIPTTS